LFTRLERNVCAVLVVLALCAAIVLAAPAPAQAQAASARDTGDARADRAHVVVRPGDSLWAISGRYLGPNATPQRVAKGAERIYALNRGRIGGDPNQIFVGQELLVPPVLSERAAVDNAVEEGAGAGSRDLSQGSMARTSAVQKAAGPPLGEVAGGASVEGGQATRTTTLPSPSYVVAAVPHVKPLTSNDSLFSPVSSFFSKVRAAVASAAGVAAAFSFEALAEARADGRPMLGYGVLLLTVVVAALMSWKLPMRSTSRRDFERWGIPVGQYGELSVYDATPLAYHPASPGDRNSLGNRGAQNARHSVRPERVRADTEGRIRRTEASEVPIREASAVASAVARSARHAAAAATGRVRAPKAKSVPRNGLALGAHDSRVRDAVRRANVTVRARKHHPRRRVPGRQRPLVAVERMGRNGEVSVHDSR
jgi:LysM domain